MVMPPVIKQLSGQEDSESQMRSKSNDKGPKTSPPKSFHTEKLAGFGNLILSSYTGFSREDFFPTGYLNRLSGRLIYGPKIALLLPYLLGAVVLARCTAQQ